mmetsp:Transcript_5552/g.13822  ORF Transcript_5552/g.13822 Transcript_5552/m.13822 type:complete len:293 (-) Transcript_5552:924-1802(-)
MPRCSDALRLSAASALAAAADAEAAALLMGTDADVLLQLAEDAAELVRLRVSSDDAVQEEAGEGELLATSLGPAAAWSLLPDACCTSAASTPASTTSACCVGLGVGAAVVVAEEDVEASTEAGAPTVSSSCSAASTRSSSDHRCRSRSSSWGALWRCMVATTTGLAPARRLSVYRMPMLTSTCCLLCCRVRMSATRAGSWHSCSLLRPTSERQEMTQVAVTATDLTGCSSSASRGGMAPAAMNRFLKAMCSLRGSSTLSVASHTTLSRSSGTSLNTIRCQELRWSLPAHSAQ